MTRLKGIALVLLAVVFVTVGYLETQENLLGVKDDAFKAFAALNTANNQATPAVTTAMTNAIATAAATTSAIGGQAVASWAAGTNYTGATLEAVKNAFLTNDGVALPLRFTPLIPVEVVTVTHVGGTGTVVGIAQATFTSANFDGTKPSGLTCYKLNQNTNVYDALPYVTTVPSVTAPTVDSWALFNYNAGNPQFLSADTTMTATTEIMLVCYITDDGNYDSNAAANTIDDPPALGALTGGGGGLTSSSSSGCVFNPAATLSLEWLLLLIAPALMIARRRFK